MPSAFFPPERFPGVPGPVRRRRVTWRLHPALTNVLNQLEGTALGQAFKDRALEVSTSKVLSDPIDHAAALTAHRWLLERAEGDGLQLTAAGYIKPTDVKALAAVMPEMESWIFTIGREIDAHPVLYFREQIKEIGLIRKYKGTLRLTRAGRAGLAEPKALWRHLAETLIPTGDGFNTYSAVVILVHAATSEGEPDLDAIARTMTAIGWKHQNDAPVTRTDVHPVWNDLWTTLGNIGERAVGEHRSSRVLSGPARILANEALFEESGREDTDFGP